MILRQARASDFLHLETFVWQAIFPAFDQPGLSDAQRGENDALVEGARAQVAASLADTDTAIFVAIHPKNKGLVGYIIANAAPRAYAEIPLLMVKRSYWGKGLAAKLMAEATNFIGRDRAVSVAVRYYNQRAIAFFAKHDFEDTGETTGDHAIPRTLLLREAYEDATPLTSAISSEANLSNMDNEKDDAWDNFPTGADEPVPVFEALPDYRLKTDEDVPLFETGANALATEVLDDSLHEETTLNDDQLSELEAFIARARAKKGTPASPEDDRPTLRVPVGKPAGAKREVTATRSTPSEPDMPSGKKAGKTNAKSTSRPAFDRSKISFEVDYGDGLSVEVPLASDTDARIEAVQGVRAKRPSFEFAFDAAPATAVKTTIEDTAKLTKTTAASVTTARVAVPAVDRQPKSVVAPATKKRTTKHCPDCSTTLPTAARFCFSCGYPQPEIDAISAAASVSDLSDTAEDFLTLGELPEGAVALPPLEEVTDSAKKIDSETADHPTSTSDVEDHTSQSIPKPAAETGKPKRMIPARHYTLGALKRAFREHLHDRVTAYFGARKVPAYHKQLEDATGFQQLRDGILTNLLSWLNEADRKTREQDRRLKDTLADLTEYFIVETAATLSSNVLPQRLLRHQSVNWESVDLFHLVMDYLDFDREREAIYTDFVTMPARALRNATKSFLRAGKDERIFFICDQSLVSQAKNGFAITDSGIYWKNVLQPAGVAMFNEITTLRLKDGYLDLDGQFFNGGGSLNLKIALLLDKLRRMG